MLRYSLGYCRRFQKGADVGTQLRGAADATEGLSGIARNSLDPIGFAGATLEIGLVTTSLRYRHRFESRVQRRQVARPMAHDRSIYECGRSKRRTPRCVAKTQERALAVRRHPKLPQVLSANNPLDQLSTTMRLQSREELFDVIRHRVGAKSHLL